MEVITKEKVDERDGSKILKLIQHFCPHGVEGDQISLFVDFHLKMLYSAHKNKKAPAYMLKSILISLDKVDFDRLNENYKKKALDVLKLHDVAVLDGVDVVAGGDRRHQVHILLLLGLYPLPLQRH